MVWQFGRDFLKPRFELKVAWRYLCSSPLQTGLILLGIVVGIVVYTFIAALINGLATRLTNDVVGNLAHVTLEPPEREPALLRMPPEGRPLVAVQRLNQQRTEITGWRHLVATIAQTPGVSVVVPQVIGNGFIQRGEKIAPVNITGCEPENLSAIIDVAGGLVRGQAVLAPGEVLIGVRLAEELGVTTGQRLLLQSERGRSRALLIRGLFDVGSASVNERVVFVELGTAQALLDLQGSVTQIAVKLQNIFTAQQLAVRLAGSTGLQARNWIDENRRLQEGLRSQGMTGDLIKIFSLLVIIIGVASKLLLAAVRRSPEIGIMRSMGVGQTSIIVIFLLQGWLLGLVGSSVGAGVGWFFCEFLRVVTLRPDGRAGLPVDPAQGEYGLAIILATVFSTLAAILPARAAAKVDPVEVLHQ
ncbi:MAG: ABC transporter permease [candidate division KSB1 bacterium]|nr:ABC transporter permease [candidate division KSB1 bacterium]MDZ7275166.1 ABC transporter permease [candidate division KSB1 bacterium]MDZ7287335.1 ABC transporter permease [candidate division KSB1 bacterium]MDZ7299449.1 ABC transporter permease [candidate division KSB1 bacterium]MDZ7305505.1 ABC transporter permease [candidate division KSB1 bacterium]